MPVRIVNARNNTTTVTITDVAPVALPLGTTSYVIPANTTVESIRFIDAANPANVSIGTSNGGNEIDGAFDIANGYEARNYASDLYFAAATTIYFNNTTPTTKIIIKKYTWSVLS